MTEIRLDTDIAAEAADHLRQLSAGLETAQSSVNSVYQTLTLISGYIFNRSFEGAVQYAEANERADF